MFGYVGTADNDAYLTIPTAVEFRKTTCGGDDNITNHMINLAKTGGDKAAQILGTEVLDNSNHSLRQCAFANVRLPLEYGDEPGKIPLSHIGTIAQFIAVESVKAKTFFAIILYNGSHWWRISTTIMIDEEDIIWGATVMKDLCQRIKRGEYETSPGH